MNQELFLNQLGRRLSWYLSDSEIKPVLQKYQAIFADAENSGKTQAQLCEELGTPKRAAKKHLAESGFLSYGHTGVYIWIGMALIVLFYPLLMLLSQSTHEFSHIISYNIAYDAAGNILVKLAYIIFAPIAVIVLTGRRQTPHKNISGKKERAAWALLLIAGILLAAICALIVYTSWNTFAAGYPDGAIEAIARMLNACLAAIFIASALWLAAIIFTGFSKKHFSCSYFLYAGILSASFECFY